MDLPERFCWIDFSGWKGSALTRFLRFLVMGLMAGALGAAGVAQAPDSTASFSGTGDSGVAAVDGDSNAGGLTLSSEGIASKDNPVARVRKNLSFHYGPFVNGGVGLGNRSNFQFLSAGIEGGKILTPVIGHGFLAGQFEYAANIMPLWLGFTPAPHQQSFSEPGGGYFEGPDGGGTYVGFSITPVIFRWDFAMRSKRVQPWFQAAGGLIYTTHKYPPDLLIPHGDPGGTSVFNFTPQGGGGLRFFLQNGRSIDLGVNGVHISSASLGDRNPGVNASVQVQVGYTFWR
jgi:lipid A 3-O-deacylase